MCVCVGGVCVWCVCVCVCVRVCACVCVLCDYVTCKTTNMHVTKDAAGGVCVCVCVYDSVCVWLCDVRA